MKTKKVTITLTQEIVNKGKKDSKKFFGRENLSGYISFLITGSKNKRVITPEVEFLVMELQELQEKNLSLTTMCNDIVSALIDNGKYKEDSTFIISIREEIKRNQVNN